MTRVLILLFIVAGLFSASLAQFGYWPVYQVGYGAFSLMAAMISLTFLWLWARKETPLALGMSFSWAGAASVMGWWWMFNVLSQPAAMAEHQVLFLFLSLYFVGAILHFAAIMRTFDFCVPGYAFPVSIALLLALAVELVT
ncbi:MAG: hypothetical protein AAF762_02675 [Pseudomonadota bacterium]